MRISNRILITVAGVVIGTGLLMAGISLFAFQRAAEQGERELADRARHTLITSLDARAQRNLALAEMLSNIPEVQAGIERNDRAALLTLLGPMFERMKVAYEVDNIHLHTPASVTILRLHNPKLFGDDLSGFRHIVVAVNADLKPRYGLEEGVHGIPARGVVAVRNAAGRHVGSLEVGTFVRDEWLKRIVPEGTSYTLLTTPGNGRFTVFASSAGKNARLLSDDYFAQALQGRLFDRERRDEQRVVHLKIGVEPLVDYSGKTIGAFEVAVDITSNRQAYQSLWQKLSAGLMVTLGLSGLMAWLTGRRLVRPIGELTLVSRELAVGNLSISFPDKTTDLEIAAMCESLEVFRRNMLRLQLTIQAGNIGLWDWDLATNHVFFSTEWKRQLGYGNHEIQDRFEEWESRLHAEDAPRIKNILEDFLRGSYPHYEVEFRLRHKDGGYRWIHARGELLRDAAGKPQRLLGCHVDVTERKQAEGIVLGKMAELQRWFDVTLDREEQMIGMKREVNELLARLGQPPKYSSPGEPAAENPLQTKE